MKRSVEIVTIVMDGTSLAQRIRQHIAKDVAESKTTPRLRIIRVGDDAASARYVRLKCRSAQQVGIVADEHWLPGNIGTEQVAAAIRWANEDASIDGVMVQLPLPPTLDLPAILREIDPTKDVDGLTSANLGALVCRQPAWIPPTASGIMQLLHHYEVGLAGRRAVILGLDPVVTAALAALWLEAGAIVSWSKDLPSPADPAPINDADVVLVALDRPQAMGAAWIKSGAAVIDTGNHRLDDGQWVGDVRWDEVSTVAKAMTPVPGGVGPMTVAALLQNTWASHQRRRNGGIDDVGTPS
jgi:methylenetetrahydrofolate dehydrogenase (NADP+)/methenyltetrahydrofolate cyclohydrolase